MANQPPATAPDGMEPAAARAGPSEEDSAVAKALDRLDRAAIVDELAALIAIPSLSGDEDACQRHMAARLDDIGMDVDTWPIDMGALAADPWFSAEVERDIATGVVGRLGDRNGPALLIDGHVDVVPEGDPALWTTPAFSADVRDGRVFGRGACDMKGGLAAAIQAVSAIRAAGIELAGTVMIAPVVGEEDGGSGTLALLRHGIGADACVIPEPTGMAVVPAVAGALSWRIRVPGRSAHGCLREEGVSAIEAFLPVHRAVLALEEQRNRDVDAGELFGWLKRPFAICGGRIEGGDWPSSEADWLVWEGRYGVAPGEDLAAARGQFESAVAGAAGDDPWLSEHPPTVEWWGGQFYPGATDPSAPIVGRVTGAVGEVTGRQPLQRAMPYGCDLGLTTGVAEIPTVVFGPGDIRDAHRPDESVPIDDLVDVARVLIATIVRTCGVRP